MANLCFAFAFSWCASAMSTGFVSWFISPFYFCNIWWIVLIYCENYKTFSLRTDTCQFLILQSNHQNQTTMKTTTRHNQTSTEWVIKIIALRLIRMKMPDWIIMVCIVALSIQLFGCAISWCNRQVSPQEQRAQGAIRAMLCMIKYGKEKLPFVSQNDREIFTASYDHLRLALNESDPSLKVKTSHIVAELDKGRPCDVPSDVARLEELKTLIKDNPKGWFRYFRELNGQVNPSRLFAPPPDLVPSNQPPASEKQGGKEGGGFSSPTTLYIAICTGTFARSCADVTTRMWPRKHASLRGRNMTLIAKATVKSHVPALGGVFLFVWSLVIFDWPWFGYAVEFA